MVPQKGTHVIPGRNTNEEGELMELVINGFPGYTISEDGKVKSLKSGRIRKPRKSTNGYLNLDLWNGGKSKVLSVHRLVAEAFIDNPYDKPQVNHIDGNKSNNDAANLEWATASENTQHAHDTGLRKVPSGKDNPQYGKLNNLSSKRIMATLEDGTKKIFPSAREAIRQGYGTQAGHISQCANGYRKRHKGITWKLISI